MGAEIYYRILFVVFYILLAGTAVFSARRLRSEPESLYPLRFIGWLLLACLFFPVIFFTVTVLIPVGFVLSLVLLLIRPGRNRTAKRAAATLGAAAVIFPVIASSVFIGIMERPRDLVAYGSSSGFVFSAMESRVALSLRLNRLVIQNGGVAAWSFTVRSDGTVTGLDLRIRPSESPYSLGSAGPYSYIYVSGGSRLTVRPAVDRNRVWGVLPDIRKHPATILAPTGAPPAYKILEVVDRIPPAALMGGHATSALVTMTYGIPSDASGDPVYIVSGGLPQAADTARPADTDPVLLVRPDGSRAYESVWILADASAA